MKNLKDKKCFECDGLSHHEHHVVPRVFGGTQTVSLCNKCHSLVHGISIKGHKNIEHSLLVKEGQKKAKEKGILCGRQRRSSEIIEEIFNLRKQGKLLKEIYEITRVSVPSISRYLNGYRS